MNKKNKKLILITAIVVILAVIILAQFIIGPRKNTEGKFTLILDYGNNNKKVFQVKDTNEERAWSLLQQATALSGIDLEATNDFWPKKINEHTDGLNNKHWTFYVNGTRQNLSPLKTVVKPPAEIVFRLE